MINDSVRDDKLIETMIEERPSALYFLKKKYGGRIRLEQFKKSLIEKALSEKRTLTSEIVKYKSKNGNEWFSYIQAKYYDGADIVKLFTNSFIFNVNGDSCVAFLPTYKENDKTKPNGAFIFTSHFFDRLTLRTHKQKHSIETIQQILECSIAQPIEFFEDGKIIYKIEDGYAYGTFKTKPYPLVVVKTFLKPEQLTKSQQEKAKKVDAIKKISKGFDGFVDVHAGKLWNNDISEFNNQEYLNALKILGLENIHYISMLMNYILYDLFYKYADGIYTENQFAAWLSTSQLSGEFIKKWKNIKFETIIEKHKEELQEDIIREINAFIKTKRKVTKEDIKEIMDDSIQYIIENQISK